MDMDRIVLEVKRTLEKLQTVVAEEAWATAGEINVRLCLDDEYFTLHMFKTMVDHYLATLDSNNESAIADAREEWEGIIRRCCRVEMDRRSKL